MKKIWKRSLSLLLAFVMVFGMLPVSVFAEESEPVTTEETSVTEPMTEETTVPVTEVPAEEITVPATEAPVEETTVPVTEALEAETTAPEIPIQEIPVKDKVSQGAANSVAEAPALPEETQSEKALPVIQRLPMISSKSAQDVPGNDELFAAYADHVWFGTDIALFGTAGADRLNADTRMVYNALVGFIKDLASGNRTNGMIKVGADFGEDYTPDVEIYPDWNNFNLHALTNALLADMPYEMYWFNKAIFMDGIYAEYEDGSIDYQFYFYFSVASQYNSGEYYTFTYESQDPTTGEITTISEDVCYYTSKSKILKVQNTLSNAQAVVDEIAKTAQTDYDKLLAYKDWICANTNYNQDVKYNGLKFENNCDPWQVIYVFDKDVTTDVVCEGYSKAFQLMCELSTFSKKADNTENVFCYSVGGELVGVGPHMWNIVEIDGQNYLADITDCEQGTVGEDGSLFLAGTTNRNADNTYYTFYNTAGQAVSFEYDEDTLDLWGNYGNLTLSDSNYEPPVVEPGMTHAQLLAALADCDTNDTSWVHETITTLRTDVNDGILTTSFGENSDDQFFYLAEGGILIVPAGCRLEVYNPLFVQEGGKIIVENGGTLYVCGLLSVEGGTVYIADGGSVHVESGHNVEGKITFAGDTAPYLTSTWLDNYDNSGWYMNEELHEIDGLMAMEEHWRIFFLNTWDDENMVWNCEPVVPTVSSEYMTITRVMDMDNQFCRQDQDLAYANCFVCVKTFGTLDRQDVTLAVNGISIPFKIHERQTGFFRTTEFSLENLIEDHNYTLDTTAAENTIYWLVRDPVHYDVRSWKYDAIPWQNQDFSDYTGGEPLVELDTREELINQGIYKFTVNPDFVNHVQYDYKNFELRFEMVLDYNGDNEIHDEYSNCGLFINPPEPLVPVAVVGINDESYLFYEDGAVYRKYPEYDESGRMIMKYEPSELNIRYVPGDEDQLILNNVNLTSLSLHYMADENGDYAQLLPDENITVILEGENRIENHGNSALRISAGTNVTISGDGSLYLYAQNSPENVNEEGTRYAYSTVSVQDGSSLTIGGNVTITAEIDGSGFHGDVPAQLAAFDGYCDDPDIPHGTLTLKDNAILNTRTPEGLRRYDGTGTISQTSGYVGIQNFDTVNISGGTLSTDQLSFHEGGEFNLTGGTANFKDIGSIDKHTSEEGREIVESYYEAINMFGGIVNISGGELNIDVSAREDETVDQTGFCGINVVEGILNIDGGTININATTEGVAILADCRYDEENNPLEDTGSYLNVTGGTININVPGKTYHGGIIVNPCGQACFSGGKITDDYGVYRFFGETLWTDKAELKGLATNVYTHGPANFFMSGGSFNLTGDSYEENGETIRNRAIFETNGSGSIYGGKINLTNGTYINNMDVSVDDGKITIENNWPQVPGLENYVYFATTGGTIDITANGIAIENAGSFHQMGGEITATNTSGSLPVMVSTGSTMQNSGCLNLNGIGGVGLVQAYDFELAADADPDNDSMLFLGLVDGMESFPAPELNITGTQIGLYLNGPGFIADGANVNIQVQGEPINDGRKWPMAIYVEKHTGNLELTGDNVSSLIIASGANLNLVSRDTANVDAMSKGIVSWYSPVAIGTDAAPNLTIDAEMALYSMTASDSEDDFNIFINGEIRSMTTGNILELTGTQFAQGEYLYSLKETDGSYAGSVTISQPSGITTLEELKGQMTYQEDTGRWHLDQTVYVEGSFALDNIVIDVINGGRLYIGDGVTLTVNQNSHLIAQENGTIRVNGQISNKGILAADRGSITFADTENGYVAASDFAVLNVHEHNGVLSPVTGVPYACQTLKTECSTVDQMYRILGMENRTEYGQVEIHITDDLELITTTIPKNVILTAAPGITITVPAETFLTVEGAVNIRNSDLVVDGTLINNAGLQGGVTFNLSEVTVNGKFDNNGPTFINDGSVMTVNGTLNNRFALHVGYWRDANTASPAGTLNIAADAALINADYLQVSPEAQIREEDGSIRHCGGVMNILAGGVLENSSNPEAQTTGFIDQGGQMNVYGILAFSDGNMNLSGTLTVAENAQTSLGRAGQINVLAGGSLVNQGYFGLECGTINGNIDNQGTVSVTWIEGNVGTVNGTFLSGADHVDLYMPFNDVASAHDEKDLQEMVDYAKSNGIRSTTIHFTRDYKFTDSFTVPGNMTFVVGAYQNDSKFSGTTVTFPANTKLTIEGAVQVAKKSALVIEGDIALDENGSFYASGNCSDSITWELNSGILTIDGTGDMLHYTEDSAPWADYDPLIESVNVTLSVPAEIQDPEALKVLCQEEELERSVFQKDGVWYVSFTMDSYADFEIVEAEEIIVDTGTISLYQATLELESIVYLNIYTKITGFENTNVPENMGLMVWTGDESIYNADDFLMGNENVTVYHGAEQAGTNLYKVQTPGIAAKKLGDEQYMRIYVRLADGSYIYSRPTYYGPQKYALDRLQYDKSEDLKRLLVAMLDYAAAAQIYFDYHTDNLANNIDQAYLDTYRTAYSADMLQSVISADSAVIGELTRDRVNCPTFIPSLILEGIITNNYSFMFTSEIMSKVDTASVMFWDKETYEQLLAAGEVFSESNATLIKDMELGTDGTFKGGYDRTAAKNMGDSLYICAMVTTTDGHTYYSGVASHSAHAYISGMLSSTVENLPELLKSLTAYGDLAKIYFADR